MIPLSVDVENKSTKEHITLGQQILDRVPDQECEYVDDFDDISDEFGDNYMKQIRSIIAKYQHKRNPYYIHEMMKWESTVPGKASVLRQIFQARWTRPYPNWGQTLYKVDNRTGSFELQWSLPMRHEVQILERDPKAADPQLMGYVNKFKAGKLT